ncbi:Deoxycytidine monophosphate (dCMP) deaminase [Puccinia graminis f. sp. tritici]|uniref:Deoxycytidylate deaminase n=1 Tax=Puccinia graminis f. sp. tritici TaxID=56615 RepID=A0A5B0PLF8_PUCGR|nr:Deoxycytidine monophosphate (dCMP) deaminase [Puccinia graminis f. sp. tritici]
MLVGLIGARGTGKKTIARELVTQHSFRELSISTSTSSTSTTETKKKDERKIVFSSAQELLDFFTSNWTHDFVTLDLRSKADILPFLKRPAFVLVFVQARIFDRWNRILSISSDPSLLSFEEFVREDDDLQFGTRRKAADGEGLGRETTERKPTNGNQLKGQLEKMKVTGTGPEEEEADEEEEGGGGGGRASSFGSLSDLASYTITNDLPLSAFLSSLYQRHLPEIRKSIRPCWDSYFTQLANLASLRSNCMKRRVGAVLVTVDKRVLSTGYNGTPRGMLNCNEGGCVRCNGQNYTPNKLTDLDTVVAGCGVNLEECLCLHAEENALLEAGRDRITNSTLYCNTCPCLRCSIKIVQCGVKEVVYSQSYSMDQLAQKIFLEAGIKLRQFN